MKGATVIIANEHSAPAETVHPGLFFTQSGEESEPMAAGKFEWNPEKSASGPVSLLVNSADKTLYVYRNGVEIGRAGMPNSNPPRKDSSPFSKCRKARRFCSR